MILQQNQPPDDNLLFNAATVWNSLIDYRYVITYGYKCKLHNIYLTFQPEDFQHLAGFQYLKDIRLPRYNSRSLFYHILGCEISHETIVKGTQYETMVKPRLLVLSILKNILDNDFNLFSFNPRFLPFHTAIKADYLISYHSEFTSFVFMIKANEDNLGNTDCICHSVFTAGERHYEVNQRSLTILKKQRLQLSTNETDILFDRLKH